MMKTMFFLIATSLLLRGLTAFPVITVMLFSISRDTNSTVYPETDAAHQNLSNQVRRALDLVKEVNVEMEFGVE